MAAPGTWRDILRLDRRVSQVVRRCGVIASFVILATGCRTVRGPVGPDAVSLVEGTAAADVRVDTTRDHFKVLLGRARFWPAERSHATQEFWRDVSVLDLGAAERDARSVDQRAFTAALRSLMTSDPQGAAILFATLHRSAADTLVRERSRVGLTMALTWSSDWSNIAALAQELDPSGAFADSGAKRMAVERWAHAFANVPPASVSVPDQPTVVELRRSSTGVPIARVRINGHPHDFWLDTGSSMTVVSDAIAARDGVRLAARDTLALGVMGGEIDARAVLIDSLALGRFVARGVTAAIVSANSLEFDYEMVDGQRVPVRIDGVLGADMLRYMDLVIDASAGTISISRPRRSSNEKRNLFWVGFPVVRLITHDGRPLLFGLDTGAEGTFVTTELLRKLPRTPVAVRGGRINGLGGKSEHTEWVVREIEVSDGAEAIELQNVPVAADRPWTFLTFDGVIGSDIALGTRLHLDFENGIFDIRPTAAPPQPFVRQQFSPSDVSH